MTIRDATVEDARALAELHVETWRQAYAGLIADAYLDSLSVEKRATAWRQIIEHRVTETRLHEVDGELAGFASYGRFRRADGTDENAAELLAIYSLQAHQGSGLAHRMMHQALQ